MVGLVEVNLQKLDWNLSPSVTNECHIGDLLMLDITLRFTLKNTVSLLYIVFDDAPEFMLDFVDPRRNQARNRAPQWLSASSCDPVRIAVASPTEPGWRSWKSQVEGKKSSGLEVFRTVPWFSYGMGGYILLSNPRAEPAP